MPVATSREAYLQTGLDILSDLGYGGLKLAEVCRRLGVTSGAFYHYYPNWTAYRRDLVDHWRDVYSTRRIDAIRDEPSARRRVERILTVGVTLPHEAEAAVRAWAGADDHVRAVVAAVDSERHQLLSRCIQDLLADDGQATLLAKWAMYVLIGYAQATLPASVEELTAFFYTMLDAFDDGRLAAVFSSRGSADPDAAGSGGAPS